MKRASVPDAPDRVDWYKPGEAIALSPQPPDDVLADVRELLDPPAPRPGR